MAGKNTLSFFLWFLFCGLILNAATTALVLNPTFQGQAVSDLNMGGNNVKNARIAYPVTTYSTNCNVLPGLNIFRGQATNLVATLPYASNYPGAIISMFNSSTNYPLDITVNAGDNIPAYSLPYVVNQNVFAGRFAGPTFQSDGGTNWIIIFGQ